MKSTTIPQIGTRDHEMWLAGATAESRALVEGMTPKSKELFNCVQILAQDGDGPDQIVRWIAVVFTADWTLRQRLALCWRLLRRSRWRRTWKVYVEPRDWWVGYYRGDDHHYVCLLPCVVLRWNRRRR